MRNSVLNDLLREYELKKLATETEAEQKREKLYVDNKRLKEIDDELNNFALSTVKSILSDNNNSTKELEKKIDSLKKEKKSILSKLNIDEIDLSPKYDCSKCSDTGYIQDSYTSSLCKCIKQKMFDIEYNKSNLGNVVKENFNTFNINLYSDEIDEKKYSSNISPRENIVNIKRLSESFVENFDNPDEKNLLFTGGTGLGKTFLSNCIADALLKKEKTVLYQTSSVMLDTIIDYRFGKENVSKETYNSLLDVDLLIIDDLGTETMNNMKFSELFNILNARLLNQNNHITKTIISTNLSLQNLFKTYDERIVSRIVGYYNICRFFGDDIRFKREE